MGNEVTFPIHFSPDVIEFINRMSSHITIVWLTTWTNQANTRLAPALGIAHEFPEGFTLAGMNVDTEQYSGWGGMNEAKKMAVLTLADTMFAGRPLIWTDDQIFPPARHDVERALSERTPPVPSLIIAPNHHIGLSAAHMRSIEDFLDNNS